MIKLFVFLFVFFRLLFLARNYKLDQAEKMLRQVRNEITIAINPQKKRYLPLVYRIYSVYYINLVVGVAAIEPGERNSRDLDAA